MDNQWWKNQSADNNTGYEIKKKISKPVIVLIIIGALLLFLLSTMWYTVNDKQQAVITTFGKVTDVTGAGIHLKLPFGIQMATIVDTETRQKIEIGYRTMPDGQTETVTGESKMISGDYNIVNVDFFVEYKISDPVKYLYNSSQPGDILKNLSQSEIRNVVSSYDVDKILTTGKSEIQSKIKESLVQELSEYDLGLIISDVKIQDSEPPTREVTEAFKEVETAKQDKETSINIAEAYENAQIPLAQAEADKLLQNAEYLKQDRINQAKKQVAMFNAMYAQYALNPTITMKRMYYEAIESVFPDVKVYVDASNGSTQKLLPLESFIAQSAVAQ